MRAELASQRYLQRHIEPGLPDCSHPARCWQQVLVIPAYRESPSLLRQLAQLPAASGKTLVILVLNRPDSDSDENANAALREAASELPASCLSGLQPRVGLLNEHTDLFLYDLDTVAGPIPAAEGVGLARKSGCDLAFKWISQGIIDSQWICSSDADAALPADYFLKLRQVPAGAVAAVYPFNHIPGPDQDCNHATALYELRLHHYVLGLEYAGSPYAYHTLGSSLAVRADQYAQVRGFPKRAGGEDFYLLNKLAKLGPIARLRGDCIGLQSRHSQRAPFGTGPAVAKISTADVPADLPLFYHPASFEALRCLLAAIPALWQQEGRDLDTHLQTHPVSRELAPDLLRACSQTVQCMGVADALAHCHRQGKSPEQFLRQFQQWFDGFRTLKFVHGIRDAGWPEQSLGALEHLQPRLWQVTGLEDMDLLRGAVRRHWGWTV